MPAKKLTFHEKEAARSKRNRDEASKKAHAVKISKVASWDRRNAALADVFLFLETYFGHRFYNPLTTMHREIVLSALELAKNGGERAIAAPRGEGKTTIAECLIIYCLLAGILKFPIIIAANKEDASRILSNIKDEFEQNDLLAKDFPETCDPIRALEGGPAKPKQHVNNQRTLMKWQTDLVVLPTTDKKYKSNCCGAVLTTRGIDAAIRGVRVRGRRPDFVLADDLETRESANSESQTKSRREIWDRDIAGLGGQSRRIGTMVLGTNQNQRCLMQEFTDRQRRPSMAGIRYSSIVEWPANAELWADYTAIRRLDPARANALYAEKRATMDQGAVLGNPARYSPPNEVSSLQRCYNFIADHGLPAFLCEYQNEPPDEDELNPDQISSNLVAKRISGLEHRELPNLPCKLVSFVDIGERNFNWVDCAWIDGCIGYVLDYGITDVKGGDFNPVTKTRDPKTLELAIQDALHDWRTQLLAKYSQRLDLALIDSGSGLHTKAVYKFCREVGRPFFPSKGMGEAWAIPQKVIQKSDKERWALTNQPEGVNLYQFEATHWKKFCHERFLTATLDANNQHAAGSLSIFVCPENAQFLGDRREYTHQVVGQVWGVKKIGGKPSWIPRGNGKDHFLDATAGCCLAGNICGVRLLGPIRGQSKRLSLKELAAKAAK